MKAALHRGRTRLAGPEQTDRSVLRAPAPAALKAFCDAFNARDLDRLTALLLNNSTVEMVGLVTEYGAAAARDPDTGSFYGTMFGDLSADDPRGGVETDLRRGVLSSPARVTLREHRGEQIILYWYAHTDGDAVRAVARVVAENDRIRSLRNYFYAPDVIAEVCGELNVPYRINGYRYWLRGD